MNVVAGKKNVVVIPATVQSAAPGGTAGKKLRVAAYCRVSSEKDEQLNSFEVQKSYYTEKISGNPEWEMAGIFADEGITGTSMKHRDEFLKMLRRCRAGRIDLILVKSVSRFGRNTVDIMKTVRSLQERNIGVIFEKEGIDTRTMNTELMLAFHGAFSQSESESIRENVSWGHRRAFQQGKVNISPLMYGFRKNDRGEVEIDEEQAEVIRRIFNRYLGGTSISVIKRKLEEDGAKTSRGGSKWSTSNIRAILTNEKYKGDALLQKTYRPTLFSERRVPNNGELPKYYVKDCLPPIVEPAVFDAAQIELAKRQSKRAVSEKAKDPAKGRYSGKYALSGILVCGECGAPFKRVTWARNGKKKIVWRCTNRLDFGTRVCKDSLSLEEAPLQKVLMNAIVDKYVDRQEALEVTTQSLTRLLLPPNDSDEEAIRLRIRELQKQKAELIDKVIEESDDGKCDLQFENILRELNFLQGKLNAAEESNKERAAASVRLQSIKEALEKFTENALEYNDAIVHQIVDTVEVFANGAVQITFTDGETVTAQYQKES